MLYALMYWIIFGRRRPIQVVVEWHPSLFRAKNNRYNEIHIIQTQGVTMSVKLLTATRRTMNMTRRAFKKFLLVVFLTAALAASIMTTVIILAFKMAS